MTYKVNGAAFTIQPSDGKWDQRRALGTDGNRRLIYEPTYSFTMSWDAMTQDAFDQLYNNWNSVSATGVVSVDLPQKDAASYVFKTYSNCIIDEPTTNGPYFAQHTMRVEMKVRSITL